MSPTGFPFYRHLKPRAALVLVLVLCSRSASRMSGRPPAAPLPSYWVALLMVERSYYDKDEFRERLYEFYGRVHSKIPRSIRGPMNAVDGCQNEGGKKLVHCEVLAVQWEQKRRELTLWIEEEPDRRGYVYQHDCTIKDKFEDCFFNHMNDMAERVHIHDATCHVQGRECKIKDDAFEP